MNISVSSFSHIYSVSIILRPIGEKASKANQVLTVCFPALGTNSMFSRAWHWKLLFPRLALNACFPALGTECIFSRAWHWMHVFPLLVPRSAAFETVTCLHDCLFSCSDYGLSDISSLRNPLRNDYFSFHESYDGRCKGTLYDKKTLCGKNHLLGKTAPLEFYTKSNKLINTSDILWLVELNPSISGFNLGITAVEQSWYIPPYTEHNSANNLLRNR